MKNNGKKTVIILVGIIVILIGLIAYSWKLNISSNNETIDEEEIKEEEKVEEKEEEEVNENTNNDSISYIYYYHEEKTMYLPNGSDLAKEGLSYTKLYLLIDNTYYMIYNNLSTGFDEIDYGTYSQDGNTIIINNTSTYSEENKCYYEDGPYTFTFDLDTLRYLGLEGSIDIPFELMDNTEDINTIINRVDWSKKCSN